MDKIEIIELDDEEEYEEEIDEEAYEEDKESIKKKTDRELMENIALRMISLERNMKQIQDDLVDTYNLIIEEQGAEDE